MKILNLLWRIDFHSYGIGSIEGKLGSGWHYNLELYERYLKCLHLISYDYMIRKEI